MKISEQEIQQHLFYWLGQRGMRLNTRQTVVVSEAARSIAQAVREEYRPSGPGSGWQAWLQSDDTCPASLFMLKCMRRGGPPVGEPIETPRTSAAWGNCEALLIAEPRFRDQLRMMREVSQEWWALVENWEAIRAVKADERNSKLLRVLW